MLVSLIGLIILQGAWISDAFEAGEREYNSHVNDALNAVNETIEDDEAALFVDEKFGGVDSLLHEVMVFHSKDPDSKGERVTIHERTPSYEKHEYSVTLSTGDSSELSRELKNVDHNEVVWNEMIELRLDLDSVIEATVEAEEGAHDVHRISNVVRRMTTERIFNGNLSARISKDALQEKITTALKREGIRDSFEFAVYDHFAQNYAPDFSSSGYSNRKSEDEFVKPLFENDRMQKGQYALRLQIGSGNNYVWNKVRPMVLLSALFSILILLCFGYSLYFIFKQKKISQIKNDFINNMTHELKTPLASISLAASSIKHPQIINRPEEVERFANLIADEEHRINKHIEHVLEIASLDRSELQLKLESCDLMNILRNSIRNVELSLEEAGGQILFNPEPGTAPIVADELHLTNVFTNILDNSIKYRNGQLTIEVSLRKQGNDYLVCVKDNGIGMTASEQKQAFDKFYRAESGDVHNRKGFGLGLSYVKSIVKALHGNVEMHSEKNKGTTVNVILPAQQ